MSKKEPKYPRSALDAVLSDSGTMPAARLGIRLQAFIFDWVFASLLGSLIIWKLLMPQTHPDAFIELNSWVTSIVDWFRNNGLKSNEPMPQWSERLEEAITYAQFFMTLAFWIYFAVGEVFFAGRSFGKSICRLRSISIVTMEKPLFFSAIFRAGMKTLCLLFPVLLVATIIVFRFNRRRQMGHDLLCRTAVVDERYLPARNIQS